MSLTRRPTLVPVLALTLALGGTASASALNSSGVISSGGTLQLGPPTVLSARQDGTNVKSVQQGILALGGALAGSGTITVNAVAHADGTETLTATWTCTCTVGGSTGTVDAHFAGTDNGTFSGILTVEGEGALEGLHGHGTFSGSDLTGMGGYTLDYTG
jgi:hypothetical protein